jgi:hypothetical protein
MREQEARGIKDPERFKLQQLKKEELDRRQQEAERKHAGEGDGGGLRVIIGNSGFWFIKVRLWRLKLLQEGK